MRANAYRTGRRFTARITTSRAALLARSSIGTSSGPIPSRSRIAWGTTTTAIATRVLAMLASAPPRASAASSRACPLHSQLLGTAIPSKGPKIAISLPAGVRSTIP